MSSNAGVLGIGNAIVDVLTHTDDAFLSRHHLAKGKMTLIGAERALELHAQMGHGLERSGGSAANTMVGLASLGGRASYIGKVRDDALGALFRQDLREAGVAFDTEPASDGPPTGRCLILVTPDAQRTMQTLLGASATLAPEDIAEEAVRGALITFLEGYLWDPEPAKRAFLRAAGVAHASGRRVAFTLSDPVCVERHREEFQRFVERHVDILFANEHELIALYETTSLEAALDRLRDQCQIAAITRSAKGSLILEGPSVTEVEAEPVAQVVDSTGAGDQYAAGFLYGLAQGLDAKTCGRLGSLAAAEVISHFGARPERSLAELVAREIP